jgi:hypothetical protein
MNKSIIAAAVAAAVGLSPVVADAASHKMKHHHKSHKMMSKESMSKGSMNNESSGSMGKSGSMGQSGTTGMSNSQRTPSGDKAMAPNGMPNNTSGGTGPNARGTNGE